MIAKAYAKHERVVECVRLGLQGEAAVRFVHESGYAINESGISRCMKSMGGLGRIRSLIEEGKNNREILEASFPAAASPELKPAVPTGKGGGPQPAVLARPEDSPLYETAKMTVHLPAHVYEAIRLAARAEGKTQNQLIVDMLKFALSQLPTNVPGQPGREQPEEKA